MKLLVSAVLACLSAASAVSAGAWPAWRGPQGTGVADEKNVPLRWSAGENVKWKTPLPAGNSTPIVWKDNVFVTAASDDGRLRTLTCFNRNDGAPRWTHEVAYERKELTHETNPHCAPSPVTDGEVVVAWHGSAGMVACDLEGNERWKADLGTFEHIWGYGSSPVIFEDLVILSAGPGLRAFVVALDKRTGKEVWRREFPEAVSEKVDQFRGSWSTPVLYEETNGRPALLLAMPQTLHCLDPRDGKDIWNCDGLGELVYTSPLVGDGVIVAMSGYHGPSLAVRTGGAGGVTATHRLWHNVGNKLNPQRVGSGAIVGDHLYILQDNGTAWCMEVKSGKVAWEERLGKSWSSMCHADGKLYVLDMEGTTYVLEPTPTKCQVLAENPLDELTRASHAISDGQIFIRTYGNLYCIE
ncbi:MAG: PQQ-like beta-propeller repeat protein [Planctomycetota bacterium]|nr:PQQ-binding-like beta-propeller repeat protein [Planctomycetaceae bacterium]MDQ3331158.1 PQQ-like beta-propeller repeat protein [Planctomycetota bacterium]